MIVTPYKTPKIVVGSNLFATLDACLPRLQERDVIAVTSKIIGICEGRVVKIGKTIDKKSLIIKEADYYIEDPASLEVYNYWHDLVNILNLSFKKGILSDADLIEISKRLKDRLLFSYQSYSLSVDQQTLLFEIQSLKN